MNISKKTNADINDQISVDTNKPLYKGPKILTNEQRLCSNLDVLYSQLQEGNCNIEESIEAVLKINEEAKSNVVKKYFQDNFPFEAFFKYALEFSDEEVQMSAFRCIGYACDSENFKVETYINEERLKLIINCLNNVNQYISKASSYILTAVFRQSSEIRTFCLQNNVVDIITQMEPKYYLIELLEELLKYQISDENTINVLVNYFNNLISAMISNDDMLVDFGEPIFTTIFNFISINSELTSDIFIDNISRLFENSSQFSGVYTSILKVLTKSTQLSLEWGQLLLNHFRNEIRQPCIRYTCEIITIYHGEWRNLFNSDFLSYMERVILDHTWNAVTISWLIRTYCLLSTDLGLISQPMISKMIQFIEVEGTSISVMETLSYFYDNFEEAKSAIIDVHDALENALNEVANDSGANYSEQCIIAAENFLQKFDE
ncbi:hypothetical protein TVAG_109750 [Trichomonas vaginalis G3]|uniref:Uncharacterized protein n=1 Tax=Trichomonas vaginalis (strain ATCC PRA-98 / G3) TaxID=412133 RepID=A2EAG4_TRIV3|nr:hypothetical protein TVAG_109750 [Trichomonas vaginalis G3]|eukprot:XP_001322614.1 hypothetical protein [Trichomonas vaginalis G3]